MHTKFAKRITTASRSFTRTILDLTAQNTIISFAGGLPDASLFPKEHIEKHAKTLFQTHDNSLFQYSNASGVSTLKEAIAKRYSDTKAEQIMLTNGSQQGLDLICKTFLDPHDCIVVENPSYLAALGLFHLYDATIKTVSLSDEGVDLDELEDLFRTQRPKFFYSIPTFQNPTGYSYSEENKKAVVRLARKYHVILLEDAPYEALRFEGTATTSFGELLPELTLCLGTFSKTLAPDFRIGWIKAPKEILNTLICSKESTDLQNSKFFQYLCAMMMENGELEAHTQTLIEHYRIKRDTMVSALQSAFKESISFSIPEGGMFLWVDFKACEDSMQLFERAIEKGVAFVPGSAFFADKRQSSYGRLNFTHASKQSIEEGIAKLYEAYRTFL